jgi:predicted TIM-barrel fold metal-dependent hydrolase
MMEVGTDRILYATDYPYESMTESAAWFDNPPISSRDLRKIGRGKAEKLLRL